MKKHRQIGKILLDLEVLLDELLIGHELQCGDVLNLVYGHIRIHNPDSIEVYTEDNFNPIFYYGPLKDLK